jgi:hypothetical protein
MNWGQSFAGAGLQNDRAMFNDDSSWPAGDETPCGRSCAGGPTRQPRRPSCPCRVPCRLRALHRRDRKRSKWRTLACADPDRPPPTRHTYSANETPSSAALACARRCRSGSMVICVRAFMMVRACDRSRSCAMAWNSGGRTQSYKV